MTVQNVYLALLALLGIGAIFGGSVLIISPFGEALGMPLSMLSNSPFPNFLIPGIILFVVLGITPLWVVWALLNKPHYQLAESINFFSDMFWAWSFSIYVGLALIIWIQIEMYYLQSVHWSHIVYMLWAVLIIFIALLPQVRGLYKK